MARDANAKINKLHTVIDGGLATIEGLALCGVRTAVDLLGRGSRGISIAALVRMGGGAYNVRATWAGKTDNFGFPDPGSA